MKSYLRKILLVSAVMSLALMGGALAACGESHSEHVYGDWVEVTPANCTENGLKERVCTVAGCNEKETEEIPALGHSWGASKVTKAATCTEEGERTRECSRCQKKETTPTEKLEHEWVISVSKPATCTEAGEGTKTCANCDATEPADIPALDHEWGDPVIVTPADCENEGLEQRTCTRCGEPSGDVIIPALEHQWMNTRVIKPATCTETGVQEQTCQRINCPKKTQEVEIPMLEHAWQDYFTVDKQPSFTEAGSKSHHCSRCTATKDTTAIPQLEENTRISYEFRTLRNNGQILVAPVTIVVKDGTGKEVARSSPETLTAGVFTAELLPKEYTVTVENLPAGYSCGASFKVTPFDPYCNVYLTASLREGTPSGKYKVGDVMCDFTVPAANSTGGETLKLSDILKTKKMVLLNFWFVNCGYCKEEFPALQKAYTEYQNDVAVIAFNVPQTSYNETGTMDEIKKFIKDTQGRNPFTFPFVQNAAVDLARYFVGNNYPTSVVIDREGVVREIFEGGRTLSDFEKLFAKYTGEEYIAAPVQTAAPVQAAILPNKRGEM